MENNILWKIINKHFEDNPQYLVAHHLESYNDFFKKDLFEIFKNKNPIQLVSGLDETTKEYKHKCNLYLGGRDGRRVYFGKPIIHDDDNKDDGSANSHYMYPNEARLRNMTYGMTVHFDVEVEFIDLLAQGEEPYAIGPEFLNEEELAKLGGTGECDEDYSLEFQRVSAEKVRDYKADGGNRIIQELANDDSVAATAESQNQWSFLQGVGVGVGGIDGGAKDATKKAPKPQKNKLRQTPAMAAALKAAQEKSVEGAIQKRYVLLKKLYLGKIPIMVQSDFCVLNGLSRELRHSFGECRNDPGGYFIINGKEKTISVQEKFGDNMLYIRKGRQQTTGDEEMVDDYLYSAEIRSVSENVAKPKRTLAVKLMAPTKKYTNRNLVVSIPNVRAPVPLFIVFRALGILSDKDIISMCVLDLDKYEFMLDLFEPSVHDAGPVLQQHLALQYIGELTKFHSEKYALEILTDYFLPHVGETNYTEKAYYLGHMVFRLLCCSVGLEAPTDRDNLKYKRLEPFGVLFNDLFQEYYTMQQKHIQQEFERRIYFNLSTYEHDLPALLFANYREVFGERIVDQGIKKAFKGGWGAQAHTKRVGVVQDLNRLSFNATLCHLRKINLPLDSSSKVVGPRILHNSHWGYFDFIDTPDGGNIGLHKTFAISAYMTRGYSREHMIAWLKTRAKMHQITDFSPMVLSTMTKVFVNGHWAGVVDSPFDCVAKIRFFRRNGLIPLHTSAAFNIRQNAVEIYTDAGRFSRPIFYKDDLSGKWAFESSTAIAAKIKSGDFSWEELVSGFNAKKTADGGDKYQITDVQIRDLAELYVGVAGEETEPTKLDRFLKQKAVIEYIDPNETEHSLIAMNARDYENNADKQKRYTHMEIHAAFLFGIMCNQSIFAETNPAARISFSCSQGRQACSVYHSNFHVRMDKTALVLNYGQTPILKSQLLQHIDREEQPCGENVIVAIMCYTGYNVEDAILINEGSIKRGLFNTTYYTTYSEHEERKRGQAGKNKSAGAAGTAAANTGSDATPNTDEGSSAALVVDKRFTNIESEPLVVGLKPGHDYSKLDRNGLVRENTAIDDKTIIIGMTTNSAINPDKRVDASKTTKKGQLGVVDKAFITEGEEGERIAKVRIREMRIPNMGDKMASRAGQKGVVGLVIPESNMPFTKDGLKPDLIINPHALPTRQTVGHLVECLIGKACAMYGGFGDCTAFNNDGSKAAAYGRLLPAVGFHSSGHDILYNGMTGEQIETEIFIGPNYYMRLKHMVKDKINYRALGPRTALTKQPVSGRANDGGLRIGEMERDSVIGHGISEFLRESMMERGDEYQAVVCNTTGVLAIYNPARNLFMSPMADGPLRFFKSESGKGYALDTITKYGRRFSVVSIPYSLKLLMQELATINVQLRVVTEDNLLQIESMANSGHLNRLTLREDMTPAKFVEEMKRAIVNGEAPVRTPEHRDVEETAEPAQTNIERPGPMTPDVSPAYIPPPEDEPNENAASPMYIPEHGYRPKSPDFPPPFLINEPKSPDFPPPPWMKEPASEPMTESQTGGGLSVNDYELGENVYFRKSVDLGMPYNTVWQVVKKGGRLLTLKTDRNQILGGGRNFSNMDLVQIAGANELIKPAEFDQWESQRIVQQQQQILQQQQSLNSANSMHPMQMGGGQPAAINIKFVGGNDYSKTEEESSAVKPAESNDATFSNLVIPSQKGGGSQDYSQSQSQSKAEPAKEKTIMGGLADFGQLVINKIM